MVCMKKLEEDNEQLGEKWIQKAIKNPGSLRRKLGVKEGEKIPTKKLEVKKSDSPATKKQKVLARTLRGLH